MARKRYPPKRIIFNGAALKRYEVEKAAWIAANPQASPQEYQAELTKIAARHAA